jgi:hypothetical protein
VKIHRTTPVDVSHIASAGLKATVLLAASIGLNVLVAPGRPVVMIGRDGNKREIHTENSVKASYVISALKWVMGNADNEPTLELIEAIVKMTRIDRSLERELREITGVGYPERTGGADPVPMTAYRVDAPPAKPKVIVDQTKDEPEPVHVVRREPTLGRAQFLDKARTRQWAWESEYSMRVEWSDGTVEYQCVDCGQRFATPTLAGQHGGTKHADRHPVDPKYAGLPTFDRKRAEGKAFVLVVETGERLAMPPYLKQFKGPNVKTKAKTVAEIDAELRQQEIVEPEHSRWEQVRDEKLGELSDSAKLAMIVAIIGSGDLEAENERLRARVEELEGSLRALKELLGGI